MQWVGGRSHRASRASCITHDAIRMTSTPPPSLFSFPFPLLPRFGSAFRSRFSSSSLPRTLMPVGVLGRPWPAIACASPAAVPCSAPSSSPSCSPRTGNAFGKGCREERASGDPPHPPPRTTLLMRNPLTDGETPGLPYGMGIPQ